MQHKGKWIAIIAVFGVIVVAIGLVIYFSVFHKETYQIVAVEHTTYQTSDFQGSELKFYKNGTFHVKIVYDDGQQTFFLGVGTYTKSGSAYTLYFTQAAGSDGSVIRDQMAKFTEPLTCPKSGNRIKFTDHNQQIYFFG